MNCSYCLKHIPHPRPQQRFCSQPKTCRQNFPHLTGIVTSIRQLKSYRWAMTVHCQSQPAVKRGVRIRFQNHDKSRPDGR